MTKDESLKLALEALNHYEKAGLATIKTIDAITAIKEALAQPEQKPFGHVTVRRLSQRFENHHDQYQFYPAGQSPYLDNVDECHTVYTTPPQRKPLTRERLVAMADVPRGVQTFDDWVELFGREIEAANGITGDKK